MKANYLLAFHNSFRYSRNFIFKKDNECWLVSQSEVWSLNYKLPYDLDIPNNSMYLISYLKKILSINRNEENIKISIEKEGEDLFLFCYPKKVGIDIKKVDFDTFYKDLFLKNVNTNNLTNSIGAFTDIDLRLFKIIFNGSDDSNSCFLDNSGLYYYLKDGYFKVNINNPNLVIGSEIPMGFFKALGESYFNSIISHNYNHISKASLFYDTIEKKLGIHKRFEVFFEENFLVSKSLENDFFVISPLNLVKEEFQYKKEEPYFEIIFDSNNLVEIFKEFKNALDSSTTLLRFEFDSYSLTCKAEVINNYKFIFDFPITKMNYPGKIILTLKRDFYIFLKNSALVGPIYFLFKEDKFLEILFQSKISSSLQSEMSIFTLL